MTAEKEHKQPRRVVQVTTSTTSIGTMTIPNVFALCDDGKLYVTSLDKTGGYKEWKALPPVPED
jgi:hypothetical protein